MKEKKEKTIPDYTLDQAIQEFVAHLPDSEKEQSSKDLNNFLHWYGQGKTRKLKDTKVTELDDYSDFISRSSPKAAEIVKPIKAFFTYIHKQGWTPANLSVHLRARKLKQSISSSRKPPIFCHPEPCPEPVEGSFQGLAFRFQKRDVETSLP